MASSACLKCQSARKFDPRIASHFVRHDLSRSDENPLGEAISPGHQFPQPGVVVGDALPSRPAIQISRRANKREPNSDLETPLLKTLKVLRWLMSR
jgi:hypothetical protein